MAVRRLIVARGRGGRALERLLALAREKKVPITFERREAVGAKAGARAHQGVVGLVEPPGYVELEEVLKRLEGLKRPAFLLILDGIQDPQNLGALIRTAATFGVDGVILAEHRACGLTPAVYKASAGAVEWVPVARVVNLPRALDIIKGRGIWVVGTDPKAEVLIYKWDFSLPTALVLGSEGRGLSRLVAERCDVKVAIPMVDNVASLNVSSAGASAMYEVIRQRGGPGG